MIRAAAKNTTMWPWWFRPDDYEAITGELRASGGELAPATALAPRKESVSHHGRLRRRISARLEQEDAAGELPEDLALRAPKVMDLRYGENPHQPAALYGKRGRELPARRSCRARSCRTTPGGSGCGMQLALEFTEPAWPSSTHQSVWLRRTATLAEAWRKALECDPVSAYGGVWHHRIVDVETACEMASCL